MVQKPIEEERTVYELLDTWITDTLTKNPEQSRRIFADNLYQRALSLLMGKAPHNITPLKCDSDGVLRTYGIERELGETYVTSGTPAGAAKASTSNTFYLLRTDIWVYDYDMKVKLKNRSGSYGSLLEIKAGTFYSIGGCFAGLEYRNSDADGSHDGTIQIVCYGNSNMQGLL